MDKRKNTVKVPAIPTEKAVHKVVEATKEKVEAGIENLELLVQAVTKRVQETLEEEEEMTSDQAVMAEAPREEIKNINDSVWLPLIRQPSFCKI